MSDGGLGQSAYEKPELTEHGRLADLTEHTPELPDALDATLGSGEGAGAEAAESATTDDS